MIRKALVIVVVLLFIGTCAILVPAQEIEISSSTTSKGNWLYVGGSGPGNYTIIQDAIDNASDGDTVFVYAGKYSECITIHRGINLLGESKYTTIIEIQRQHEIIDIRGANYTLVSGFTLRNTNPDYDWIVELWDLHHVTIQETIIDGANYHCGILLSGAKDNIIQHNTLVACSSAITIYSHPDFSYSKNNTIVDNEITANYTGIKISKSDYNNINNNTIAAQKNGIDLYACNNNIIMNNTILDANLPILIYGTSSTHTIAYNRIENTNINTTCDGGIWIVNGYNPHIFYNIIRNFTFGIYLKDTFNSIIEKNNFFNNTVHARFFNTGNSIWRYNYWGRPRILPKPIFGVKDIEEIRPHFFEFDRYPARKPYMIQELS